MELGHFLHLYHLSLKGYSQTELVLCWATDKIALQEGVWDLWSFNSLVFIWWMEAEQKLKEAT